MAALGQVHPVAEDVEMLALPGRTESVIVWKHFHTQALSPTVHDGSRMAAPGAAKSNLQSESA